MPHPRRRLPVAVALVLASAVVAAGCVGPGNMDPNKVQVLTTTTVFADLVSNVGGSYVQVTSLVPKGGDVHTFAPKPSDVVAVSHSKLIVMNGLGLDDWLDRTVSNASAGARTIKLAVDLPGVAFLPGETAATENPHLWLDPRYAELYADRIAEALGSVDPTHAAAYRSRAAAYDAQLEDLDAWVRTQIATVPEQNRKLVTFHDAFPYYAREYGIEVVGVAVEAPGQDPNAGYIARLISTVRAAGVKAIFSEAQFPTKLVDQLASEADCKVVADLYDDTLGDPPVTSYVEVIKWDTKQLVDALR
jgi:manganese/iron transport system substrate-binding protein